MTIEELNQSDAFARTNNISLVDRCETRMTVEAKHLNGAGVCQGGAIFTLADLSQAGLTEGQALTTAAEIHFIHSAKEGDRLIARSEWVSDGKLPVVRTRVCTEEGKLIAEMTGSLYRMNKQ